MDSVTVDWDSSSLQLHFKTDDKENPSPDALRRVRCEVALSSKS
jgi:hypothetical protein